MLKKQKKLRKELDVDKDLLIIAFDGVIGMFMNHPNGHEQLLMRPGVDETLTQLAEQFQIAIVVDYQRPNRLRAVMKALKNAPYDRLYQKVSWKEDNFFNIENILRDHHVD